MKLPNTFQPERFTIDDLNKWFIVNRPDLHGVRIGEHWFPARIEMTIEQEMWYRNLLPPEYVVHQQVMFRGVVIEVSK